MGNRSRPLSQRLKLPACSTSRHPRKAPRNRYLEDTRHQRRGPHEHDRGNHRTIATTAAQCRRGRIDLFEGQLADHSPAADLLHGRLPRPHQHRLRAAADEADAALQRAVYGLGAGIFFIGYFLFEVPSNLMLEKIGARRTLLRIMFCWGLVAAAMMFVRRPRSSTVRASCSACSRRDSSPASSCTSRTGIPTAPRPDHRDLHVGHHHRQRHRRPAVRRAS